MRHDFLCLIGNHAEERRNRWKIVLDELWLDTAPMSLLARSQHQQTPSHEGTCEGFPDLAQNVVCCETAIRLKSECAFNRSVQHRLQSIGWRLEAQGLSRTLIEPQSNRVQITLRDAREIGSSREVLPQQAVGVLV